MKYRSFHWYLPLVSTSTGSRDIAAVAFFLNQAVLVFSTEHTRPATQKKYSYSVCYLGQNSKPQNSVSVSVILGMIWLAWHCVFLFWKVLQIVQKIICCLFFVSLSELRTLLQPHFFRLHFPSRNVDFRMSTRALGVEPTDNLQEKVSDKVTADLHI